MVEMERAVRNVMLVASVTMISAPISPTLPTTHPNRRYMMTPRIVSTDGVKTPPNVPKPAPRVAGGAPGSTPESWLARGRCKVRNSRLAVS
jgi:hypothetical protein